jgi:two-component system nitrogen regulation sensor histidine kinase NtrY
MTLCDPGLVRQALTNLLQNAIESLDDNSIEAPQINFGLATEQDGIRLTVTDNGRGFPDMDLAKLLEPYVTTRQKGTGLGLAIVNKIMEDHGGEMQLERAASGGAVVTLLFPDRSYSEEKGHKNG